MFFSIFWAAYTPFAIVTLCLIVDWLRARSWPRLRSLMVRITRQPLQHMHSRPARRYASLIRGCADRQSEWSQSACEMPC
jgi:hypothetical protein